GLANPTAMEFAPDGRLFVCEQGGTLRVIKNGALLATPFLTVTVNSSGERGLLGSVVRVEFYVNGSLQCTDTSAAYTCNWRVPNQPNRSYQIQARAYDQAGNSGSALIQVTSQ
ncbi:MAG: PQQ-dependent sugar dehydrogenase, partial [Acidobacteria bacterium]|nr:PQQ-dependent sugar dehydrogenase [Acidobacteriota bacterium]